MTGIKGSFYAFFIYLCPMRFTKQKTHFRNDQSSRNGFILGVPKAGLEPARGFPHCPLKTSSDRRELFKVCYDCAKSYRI